MSDYMFMLDSHLSGEQSKALAEIREAAEQAGLNLFLTGGAMRDMMAGFAIRDLDFTLEGRPVKFAKSGAEIGRRNPRIDELRKCVELRFPGNVTARFHGAAGKVWQTGRQAQVQPATIHEDLRGVIPPSTPSPFAWQGLPGLLLDPSNGLGDLTTENFAPSAITDLRRSFSHLRMIRFRTRLGFAIASGHSGGSKNAREAELETKIPPEALEHELWQIAEDPLAGDILKALEDEKLLNLISPALAGPKLNLPGFQKLQKARQMMPFGINIRVDWHALFLFLLFEKLTPKERAQLVSAVGLKKPEVDAAAKLKFARKGSRRISPQAICSGLRRSITCFRRCPGRQSCLC